MKKNSVMKITIFLLIIFTMNELKFISPWKLILKPGIAQTYLQQLVDMISDKAAAMPCLSLNAQVLQFLF